MFLTHAQVGRLTEEAYVLLGHMQLYAEAAKSTGDPTGLALIEAIVSGRADEGPRAVSQRANVFIETEGKEIGARFASAIQILQHNAERLEAFAELDDALDAQLDDEPSSIFELLQEYVPADFDNARRIDLHAQAETGTPSLTLVEESPAQEIPPDEPPVVVHAAQAPAQPEGKFATDAPRNTRADTAAPFVRAATNATALQPQSDADSKLRTSPRFPGSRRRNPAEHFHPRDHRALSRDLRQRQDVLEARELNLIGDYDKWTPELRSLLLERSRARRAAAQGTTNISSGGRLVQPPTLER
jgi:hypothetical protein